MPYTLLLADDSVTIQRVIELTFAEENVTVVAVGDGQAAIDRLEADPPDIVLADVDMPKRDGYEVAAYVKSRPRLAHIPVVLLTGAFEPIDQARAEAAGSSDVLAKPFEPQMVINRVKQLLGKKKGNETEVPSPQRLAPEAPDQALLKAPSAPRPPARSSMAMNDEHATQQNQPARTTPGQAASQQPVSLDDYFDQLDTAFSNLQKPGASAAKPDAMGAKEEWLESQPPAPSSAYSEWIDEEPVVVAPLAAPAPEPAPAPPAPPAANSFTELSAAKSEAPLRPPAPVITDDVIEEVVARVLQRLSDRVVRETVTEIVSQTAERLVEEEISRIKTEGQ